MASASEFSVGLCHEFAITAAKAGLTPGDMASIAHDSGMMEEILGLVRGLLCTEKRRHFIDLSEPSKPPLPGPAINVGTSYGTGRFYLERLEDDLYVDGLKIGLYRTAEQGIGMRVVNSKIAHDLERPKRNAPGQLLDYLEKNPCLWPEKWKIGGGRFLFFRDVFQIDGSGDRYIKFGKWSPEQNRVLVSWRRMSDHSDRDDYAVVFA